MRNDELMHFGIPGMKWGIRRFQFKDGRRTEAGKRRYSDGQVLGARIKQAYYGHKVSRMKDKIRNGNKSDRVRRKLNKYEDKYNETSKVAREKTTLDRVVRGAKIGATVAGTALAAYGGYKLYKAYKNKFGKDTEAAVNNVFAKEGIKNPFARFTKKVDGQSESNGSGSRNPLNIFKNKSGMSRAERAEAKRVIKSAKQDWENGEGPYRKANHPGGLKMVSRDLPKSVRPSQSEFEYQKYLKQQEKTRRLNEIFSNKGSKSSGAIERARMIETAKANRTRFGEGGYDDLWGGNEGTRKSGIRMNPGKLDSQLLKIPKGQRTRRSVESNASSGRGAALKNRLNGLRTKAKTTRTSAVDRMRAAQSKAASYSRKANSIATDNRIDELNDQLLGRKRKR